MVIKTHLAIHSKSTGDSHLRRNIAGVPEQSIESTSGFSNYGKHESGQAGLAN
jgi:hypothetical protein